jgi:mannose/cellobiose epimerase-like protein (N-acyl-D-glucosamine 2-epimerase family)/anti-anti-sigma regulatory factor
VLHVSFEFSDLIAGYVTGFDVQQDLIALQTSGGRGFHVKLTKTTFGEMLRNLGEPFAECTLQMREMLMPGRSLFAYGVFYPEADKPFEAKHLVFVGRAVNEYEFEKQNWWIHQIRKLADFYLHDQFGDGGIDYRTCRTQLGLDGTRTVDNHQEADTLSGLVYGFASAFMMTGDERYLEAAEKGTTYLREHFRVTDEAKDICYWYHAVDVKDGSERKILSSESGDDAMRCNEQIYALAGPVQTYRLTGDPQIFEDARRTVNLFERYYRDHIGGGYFTHIDPVTFSGRSQFLGHNRARKNWNSIGDHAPAYLINLYLATGDKPYADMLRYCGDLIAEHFACDQHSASVQEKRFSDWSKDAASGEQQNHDGVDHNLTIAWNLMRLFNLTSDNRYIEVAETIGALMPEHGMDKQRGGWYDLDERVLEPAQTVHRFPWHDRKAWWRQEQGILAYLILAGMLKDDDSLRHASESAAFYNAWFLDQDSGGVYFNVLANGLPYVMGTERERGSHSMSGYHSFELCYLGAVYTNLLVTKQPMNFYFKPKPNGFPDNILRIAPDLLPAGAVRIDTVTINGEKHTDYDADALAVTLPASDAPLTVKVRVMPIAGVEHFDAHSDFTNGVFRISLTGELDMRALPEFRATLDEILPAQPKRLAIDMRGLKSMVPEGARALMFVRGKLPIEEAISVVGANPRIRRLLMSEELAKDVDLQN